MLQDYQLRKKTSLSVQVNHLSVSHYLSKRSTHMWRARNVLELRTGYKTVPRYKKFLVRMNPLDAVRLKSAGAVGARTNHEGPPLS